MVCHEHRRGHWNCALVHDLHRSKLREESEQTATKRAPTTKTLNATMKPRISTSEGLFVAQHAPGAIQASTVSTATATTISGTTTLGKLREKHTEAC